MKGLVLGFWSAARPSGSKASGTGFQPALALADEKNALVKAAKNAIWQSFMIASIFVFFMRLNLPWHQPKVKQL